MELIAKIESRRDKKGKLVKWAVFYCEDCKNYVERRLNNGIMQINCGCLKWNKGKTQTEGQKKKQSETLKGRYAGKDNPNYGNGDKIRGKNNPMYGVHRFGKDNPNYGNGDKIMGENNPNWKNGISFEIYPKEFKQMRKFIYERDDYTCQNPECIIENPKRLDCHHIDYNKNNNNPENLTTLCISCHGYTNGKNNRQYWTEFYQNIMKNRIMECLL